MMMYGKYLAIAIRVRKKHILAINENYTNSRIITYHDSWQNLSDCHFRVFRCLRTLTSMFTSINIKIICITLYNHLLLCLLNPHVCQVNLQLCCFFRAAPTSGATTVTFWPPCHGSPSSESQGEVGFLPTPAGTSLVSAIQKR